MRRIIALAVACLMIFSLTACADEDTHGKNDGFSDSGRVLIAYFSRAGENSAVGVIEKGNTEIIAEMIADEIGGELFHIESETPYPSSYDECLAVAKYEKSVSARPALSHNIEDMDAYDVIFIGYPIWWYDLPMPVYTFLESHDFTGKTIVPFNTHEGADMAGTPEKIADICSGAVVLDGLAVQGQTAQNDPNKARAFVLDWLSANGFIQ